MKVAVLGAGAIGAYVGAALARGGAESHLIARGAHLEAMRSDGVTVLSPRGDFQAHPRATDDPREIGPVDVVFLGLKAYSYADCRAAAGAAPARATAVVAAQNGIPWWYFHGHGGPVRRPPHRGRRPGGAVSAAIPPSARSAASSTARPSSRRPASSATSRARASRSASPIAPLASAACAFAEAMSAGGLKAPVETGPARRDLGQADGQRASSTR